MSKEKKIIALVSMSICFLLVFIYCIAPLQLGINNGGINRELESSAGLSAINNGNFYIKYNISENHNSENFQNSFSTFVGTVASIIKKFNPVFDARILTVIYLVALLVSLFYLIKYIDLGNLASNIIAAAAFIIIFFDLSYLVYLNSLYAETAFYVFFVFLLSLYIKLIISKKPQLPTTVIFVLTAVFICGLKQGFSLLAIPFSAMVIYLWFRRKGVAFRVTLVALLILLIIYPFAKFKVFPDVQTNKFNSVFYGVLYEQKNPSAELKKLGINEKYAELAGKNTFEQLPEYVNSSEFISEVYDNVTSGKLFSYYLLNPSKYISQFKYVGFNALETYPKYAGNYTMESGKSSDAKASGFKIYNLLKEKVFPKTLWFLYLLPLALVVLSIGYRKKINNNGIIVFCISLSVASFILFNLPMLNSGLVDISRTMAVYNVAFDAVVFTLLSMFIYITNKRKLEFRKEYGLSQ